MPLPEGSPEALAEEPPAASAPGPLVTGVRAEVVSRRLEAVRGRIGAAGGDPDRIRIVAVTKGHGLEAVRAALEAGLTDIGENYANELLDKASALEPDLDRLPAPHWHFLGAVQRNKVAKLAPVVSCWQSVARPEEAEAIARRRPGAEILVEVDLSGLPGRSGCPPSGVAPLVAAARAAGCAVLGLMTVAPLPEADRPSSAAEAFAAVAALGKSLGLQELSMGMSDDLEAAVAAGSTMVRIGTALFGQRPPR